MEQGLIHVYCGEGKGKTTAATGLALRAAGCGLKVIFAQFMKGNDSGEVSVMERIEGIRIMRSTKNYGFFHRMNETDKQEIQKQHNEMLQEIIEQVKLGACDLLVMDELTYPYAYGLIDKEKVAELLHEKPAGMELVITGRNPDEFFTEAADYITEMKCIRHPYEKGIAARRGIEY